MHINSHFKHLGWMYAYAIMDADILNSKHCIFIYNKYE